MNNMQMSNDVKILTRHYIPYSKLKHMNHIHILQLSWLLMPAESHLLSRTCWELDEVFIPIVLMKPPTWSTCFHHRLIIIHQLLRITELTTSARTQWEGNWWETWTVPNHPWRNWQIPSGKHTKNYGKSPFLMGKSWKIHYKWSFSIATLNYQRVTSTADIHSWFPSRILGEAPNRTAPVGVSTHDDGCGLSTAKKRV